MIVTRLIASKNYFWEDLFVIILAAMVVATIHFSTCCFRKFLGELHSRFPAARTLNSHNHSYLHWSLCKFTGERFTNHSNHVHILTPITQIVAKSWLFASNSGQELWQEFGGIFSCQHDQRQKMLLGNSRSISIRELETQNKKIYQLCSAEVRL